jgi:hypothetical protein
MLKMLNDAAFEIKKAVNATFAMADFFSSAQRFSPKGPVELRSQVIR